MRSNELLLLFTKAPNAVLIVSRCPKINDGVQIIHGVHAQKAVGMNENDL